MEQQGLLRYADTRTGYGKDMERRVDNDKKRHCGDREQRARTEAFDEKKGAAFRRS